MKQKRTWLIRLSRWGDHHRALISINRMINASICIRPTDLIVNYFRKSKIIIAHNRLGMIRFRHTDWWPHRSLSFTFLVAWMEMKKLSYFLNIITFYKWYEWTRQANHEISIRCKLISSIFPDFLWIINIVIDFLWIINMVIELNKNLI